eukprot:CAMPEP_0116030648 /NCGR_PEP_ID=MMETSP0321-20121206/16985_1 /TAXON_ID=163516 /ORGANISM="Leptocylindrus danicus var. danicus, Strain B650" /LENGTH=1039 /DNA_ID=CAMNT_0003505505 /DNA_START=57 /DNA_END=3172 /DNA_ORIENTATION=+
MPTTDKVQTTIIDASGSRLFMPPEAKLASSSSTAAAVSSLGIRPMAGDLTTPNNYIPLEDSNTFFCPTRITLGSFDKDKKCAVKESVLPTNVSLSAAVTTEHVLYELKVSFCNRLKNTSAAILAVPRIPGVLLMEEAHEVGGIKFEPKVMAKEKADAAYKDAENSSVKTATLSSTAEDTHHIKLDKVPAGASGVFGLTFIQSDGLKCRDMVLSDASEEPLRLADVVICPGYTGLGISEGVPFEFNLIIGNGIDVDLPADDVIVEDTLQVEKISPDMRCLILFDGSLVQRSLLGGLLQWKSVCGLAQGTLLKVRLKYSAASEVFYSGIDGNCSKTDEVSMVPDETMDKMITGVDSISKCFYSSTDGSPLDTSLVDISMPFDIPETSPSAEQHEVYIIVDTSGSTSMTVRSDDGIGRTTFLDTSKLLLDGILDVLPSHIDLLRKKKKINQLPIKVHLWQFNSNTTKEAEIVLEESSSLISLSILQARVKSLTSAGSTNYDSWARELRKNVSSNPSHLHSVLLVTDGGATSREYFFDAIDAITSHPGIGFFQVDCLGYGPWLDPSCVSHLAQVTGGEAIMVESLRGMEIRVKVLGMMARSILRAASSVSLKINNASVLATRLLNNDHGKQPPRVSSDGNKSPFTVSVLPGQHVRLLLLHSSGKRPLITIGSVTLPVTSEVANNSSGDEVMEICDDDDWVDIGERLPELRSSSLFAKLSNKRALHAMKHLPMLEPAYFATGSVNHPVETASERHFATLHTSIFGQIVSPSVTKGCAVAQLEMDIQPVPEHCRPVPSNIASVFSSHRSKRESYLMPSFGYGLFGKASYDEAESSVLGSPIIAFGCPSAAPVSKAESSVFGSPIRTFGSPRAAPVSKAKSSLFGSPRAAPVSKAKSSLFGSPRAAPVSKAKSSLFGSPRAAPVSKAKSSLFGSLIGAFGTPRAAPVLTCAAKPSSSRHGMLRKTSKSKGKQPSLITEESQKIAFRCPPKSMSKSTRSALKFRRSSINGIGTSREPVNQDGPPSLSSWLRMSSGGLYPSDATMEMG